MKSTIIVTSIFLAFIYWSFEPADWGFFGHKRINRLAVFTLPPEMIVFFKENIEFLTEQAVAPDKRRYATKFEAVRHYIDLDNWGEYPFENLPRTWTEVLMKHTTFHYISAGGDTFLLNRDTAFAEKGYKSFYIENVLGQYYEDEWVIECDSISGKFILPNAECQKIFARDTFSTHGIVPYHLQYMQQRLTQAFKGRSKKAVLRLAAEIGHYIADAHVPLHTTKNYNGQLTDQVGIHAFWESRIPELFADAEFDFFVGKCQYIDNTGDYFWEIVFESNRLVKEVLETEKTLSAEFSQDLQYCYEERLGQTVKLPCPQYARAYMERMNGMVEKRMREAIMAVGNCWYTAWIDAGSPDLSLLSHNPTEELLEPGDTIRSNGQAVRPHDN